MMSKGNLTCLVLMIVLIDLTQSYFTEVPPAPKRPEQFRSREELRRYLQKVHEYHLIVGRWRLRRENSEHPLLDTSNEQLFQFFDINHDQYISRGEFVQRLKVPKAHVRT